MMLGTLRPTRHRSAARVSRGWLVRGVRHERDGCQLDGIHYPQEGEIRAVTHYEHRQDFGVSSGYPQQSITRERLAPTSSYCSVTRSAVVCRVS